MIPLRLSLSPSFSLSFSLSPSLSLSLSLSLSPSLSMTPGPISRFSDAWSDIPRVALIWIDERISRKTIWTRARGLLSRSPIPSPSPSPLRSPAFYFMIYWFIYSHARRATVKIAREKLVTSCFEEERDASASGSARNWEYLDLRER